MGLAEQVNRKTVAAIVLLIMAASIAVVWGRGTGRRLPRSAPELVFFYDVEAGRLFADSSSQIAPIRDGAAARAYVFSCGDCAQADARFIGWLEKYTDEAKQVLESRRGDDDSASQGGGWQIAQAIDRGRLIAGPPDEGGTTLQWSAYLSPDANRITQAAMTQCSGAAPKACNPTRDDMP